METELKGTKRTVHISPDAPTILIGERINPTGREALAEKLRAGDLSIVEREAIAQVQAGADVIDINVGARRVNQTELLPEAITCVQQVVDVPVCLDTADPKALEEGLKICQGKPLVNSVNGEARSLETVLPLVAEYGAAVIGLCMDEGSVPGNAEARIAIARRIVERAQDMGIQPQDILIDPLALAVAADSETARVTLDTIRGIRDQLGVNMTLGTSNVSFGMPDREVINAAFLTMAIREGINAPIVRVEHIRKTILSADVLLGKDPFAQRYMKVFRAEKPSK